jgi:hypothetical protein
MIVPTALSLSKARLEQGKLRFERAGDVDKALEDGCFYLAIPDELDLAPCITLARNFYLSRSGVDGLNDYQGYKSVDGIYFDREHFQTEHILLDQVAQKAFLPSEVLQSYCAMSQIAQICLRSMLEVLKVPHQHWAELTGGAVDNKGTHWFAVSHYRSEREQLGCAAHKDTGFVTVLYIEQNGLEAMTPNGWRSIDALEGHFVVNFGASFEHLTAVWERKVHGIYHRVRRIFPSEASENRFSFAAFVNPPASGQQYQILRSGSPCPTGSVEDFLRKFNQETWRDGHHEFGIK